MACLTFSIQDHFVNLARVDPDLLSSTKVSTKYAKRLRFQLQVNDQTAICLTPIFCTASNLEKINAIHQKGISGIVHAQEFDRMAGVLSMVFNQPIMRAPLFKSALTFSTLADTSEWQGLKYFNGWPVLDSSTLPFQGVGSSAGGGSPTTSKDVLRASDHS